MQKKIFLLCICLLSIGLCACQRDISEKSSETAEQGDSWKAAYQKLLLDEDVKRMSLLSQYLKFVNISPDIFLSFISSSINGWNGW